MSRLVVVLGTGTEIGKTFVSAGLVGARASCIGLKPVESGTEQEVGPDATLLASACGHSPGPAPFVFRAPLSPHLAAELEDREVSLDLITEWVTAQRASHQGSLFVLETAGGAFSPLSLSVDNVTLAAALTPDAVLLVAPNRLGVLHDVRAALAGLQLRGVSVKAIVLSTVEPDLAASSNRDELAKFVTQPVVEVPHHAPVNSPIWAAAWVALFGAT